MNDPAPVRLGVCAPNHIPVEETKPDAPEKPKEPIPEAHPFVPVEATKERNPQ